jgi:hypothetical protein
MRRRARCAERSTPKHRTSPGRRWVSTELLPPDRHPSTTAEHREPPLARQGKPPRILANRTREKCPWAALPTKGNRPSCRWDDRSRTDRGCSGTEHQPYAGGLGLRHGQLPVGALCAGPGGQPVRQHPVLGSLQVERAPQDVRGDGRGGPVRCPGRGGEAGDGVVLRAHGLSMSTGPGRDRKRQAGRADRDCRDRQAGERRTVSVHSAPESGAPMRRTSPCPPPLYPEYPGAGPPCTSAQAY